MKFLKEHLTGFYEWKPGSEISMYHGKVTRRLFDRWNGNQVLFIINTFLSDSGSTSIEKGKVIENLLIEKLPLDARSEVSVINWLQTTITDAQL